MINRIRSFIRTLLPKNTFARSISVLVGGTAGAQLLTILAAPLITRLYSPDDFGLLSVYVSLLSLINVVSSLRYESAITLPEEDLDAANITVLCLILVIITVFLVGIILLIFGAPIAQILGVPRLADYFWLLPFGVLFSGVYTVFNYWGIRTKRFSTIAATKLRQVIAALVIQLTAFKLGGIALLFGQIARQGIGIISLAAPALAKPEFKQVSLENIKKVTIRYQHFPRFSIWSALVNTAGQQLPPLMFAAFFTAGAAGLYAMAHRILAMPASLISSALGNVFLSHAVDARRENRLGRLYLKLQDTLIQIGLPPAMLFVVAGPDIFALIFSEEWRNAGVFAQWLAIANFASFVVSPLSQIFIVLEKQKTGLILQTILFTARLFAIAIGIWNESLMLTVALFSLASLFGYTLYLFMGAKYTSYNFSNIILSILKSVFFSVILIAPILASFFFPDRLSLYVAIVITISGILTRLVLIAAAFC
ncbi:MAG: oligosaccharide flippase family protein [Candidatus Electrothrix sp. YB6]